MISINKRRKKQKGQSLIYVALLIVVIISGVFFIYDIGNIVNNKIKLQSGTDSAALAASSLKISKHHTDTLVRAAMFNESVAAQTEQRAAQAKLVAIIAAINKKVTDAPVVTPSLPPPGGNIVTPQPQPTPLMPSEQDKGEAAKYRKMVNTAYRHVVKLHRETRALQAYYDWLSGSNANASEKGIGRVAVTETARIGFRGNTLGLFNTVDNLGILDDPEDLIENKKKAIFPPPGGVPYQDGSTSKKGAFDKTFVEVNAFGKRSAQGVSLLRYADKYLLRTSSAAKLVSSEDLGLKRAKLGVLPTGNITTPIDLEFLWYSPRLMAIEKGTEGNSVH
ncbi:MAG: pilus assembly protein TadG-related protein [Candidatus Sericytochromatia bacterium]